MLEHHPAHTDPSSLRSFQHWFSEMSRFAFRSNEEDRKDTFATISVDIGWGGLFGLVRVEASRVEGGAVLVDYANICRRYTLLF